MKKCHQCGFDLPDNAKFCRNCGSQQIAQEPPKEAGNKCKKCGAEFLPGAKFCRKCGAELTPTATTNEAQPLSLLSTQPPPSTAPAAPPEVKATPEVLKDHSPPKEAAQTAPSSTHTLETPVSSAQPPTVPRRIAETETKANESVDTSSNAAATKYVIAAVVIAVFVGGGFWAYRQSVVEYDYKTLGFASKTEMDEAHNKGYHKKKTLDEMTKPPVVVTAAPTNPPAVSEPARQLQVAVPEPQPQTTVPVPQQDEPTKLPQAQSVANESTANTCDTVKACADAMLVAAKMEALTSAMESAQRIDAMPRPERGDRKSARKLNADGLEVLKQRNLAEATAIFTKAREADRADEEIIANLIYTYSEDGNFTKAEQLAYDGLLLNPRRANIWLPIAIAKQKQNKSNEALQALWLAWQFSGDKQRMLNLLDKRIAEETDGGLRQLYVNGKAWAVDGKKPNF